MNILEQQADNFIGSAEAIKNLKNKEKVKLLVLSDSHGQTAVAKKIIITFGKECDVLIFCGDGISDILNILNQSLSDPELAECIPSVICIAQGNGDSDRYSVKFKPNNELSAGRIFHQVDISSENILQAADHTIYIVHGHKQGVYYNLQNLKKEAEIIGADIVFYGHTHVVAKNEESVILINPGSCAYPRRGAPASCSVVSLFNKSPFIESVFYTIKYTTDIEFIPFVPRTFDSF